jgi:hypothetical protein
MIYATCDLATAARMQVLSVEMALVIDGGEVPTSQICSAD